MIRFSHPSQPFADRRDATQVFLRKAWVSFLAGSCLGPRIDAGSHAAQSSLTGDLSWPVGFGWLNRSRHHGQNPIAATLTSGGHTLARLAGADGKANRLLAPEPQALYRRAPLPCCRSPVVAHQHNGADSMILLPAAWCLVVCLRSAAAAESSSAAWTTGWGLFAPGTRQGQPLHGSMDHRRFLWPQP